MLKSHKSSKPMMKQSIAPGARVVIRDAEWLVRRVDRTSTGGFALRVIGLSELVRDKEAIFLTEAEEIIILDPASTNLVRDRSPSYLSSLLYIESLLRQTPPSDERLYVGHKAAMDEVYYQLEPAALALKQPRQRILIADAVGLGKTLEAGILLSELIRRGRGKRILVVTVKSMLTQFQKEIWSRFAIPLTRLDSIGLARVRNIIPTNHNPFYYYDKAIISVDTLKQDAEYRVFLENAYWDIIVIDEAHNVAERGAATSQRAKLAKLLSKRSDTLIMLSATPHDGRPRSFASLMNMLDPTAIANPDNYTPEDIKGLFIRRFKKDIQSQVQNAFKEREVYKVDCDASSEEEGAFNILTDLSFKRLDKRQRAGELFKTTLEKALFSSPAACLETIQNRINRISNTDFPEYEHDIQSLKTLAKAVEKIKPEKFSKFQKLIRLLQDKKSSMYWTGKDKADRLVIFTERIETLRFLQKHLPKALGLKQKHVEILHGSMSDIEQQRIVEDFGKDEAPVRLLIASDVASEGINLHYLCHRMIHFDIPWSLLVFQQRNGRIDRYGQTKTPVITYLITQSKNTKIKGDTRILELLIQKENEVVKNIGDPAALMGVYDIQEEERITASAIEQGKSQDEFEAELDSRLEQAFDPLSIILGEDDSERENIQVETAELPSLFESDFAYVTKALKFLRKQEQISFEINEDDRVLEFKMPEDLLYRFRQFPREIRPENDCFILSDNKELVQKEIRRSLKDESAWPKIHYLWELNPVVEWINNKVLASFRRHEAPVIFLPAGLEPDEAVYLITGIIPNRKGHPLIQHWFGVRTLDNAFTGIEDLSSFLTRTRLGKQFIPNTGMDMDTDELQSLLPDVVHKARDYMSIKRKEFEDRVNPKLDEHLKRLEELRSRHRKEAQRYFDGLEIADKLKQSRKEQRLREIEAIFAEYMQWIEDTLTTEDSPYIKVVAVFKTCS